MSQLDKNIDAEIGVNPAKCTRTAWSFDRSSTPATEGARAPTGKARRTYRKIATAIANMHDDEYVETPVMPTDVPSEPPEHRSKVGFRLWPLNACVARPVGKAEIKAEPKAQQALQKEWDRLKERHTWRTGTSQKEDGVREWRDVAREARTAGTEVHLGMLYAICVEKGSELAPALRKYKGRVVFLGNQVKNQNWEAAMFQDLGSSLATMEAGKAADIFGCIPGYNCEQADAEQAYVQAPMGSPVKTWITLPRDQWPKHWVGMEKPVVLLDKALYGHPDSGTYWEEHCDKHCQSVGFVPITNWPSCNLI